MVDSNMDHIPYFRTEVRTQHVYDGLLEMDGKKFHFKHQYRPHTYSYYHAQFNDIFGRLDGIVNILVHDMRRLECQLRISIKILPIQIRLIQYLAPAIISNCSFENMISIYNPSYLHSYLYSIENRRESSRVRNDHSINCI